MAPTQSRRHARPGALLLVTAGLSVDGVTMTVVRPNKLIGLKLGGDRSRSTYEGTTNDGVAGRTRGKRWLWQHRQRASRNTPATLARR